MATTMYRLYANAKENNLATIENLKSLEDELTDRISLAEKVSREHTNAVSEKVEAAYERLASATRDVAAEGVDFRNEAISTAKSYTDKGIARLEEEIKASQEAWRKDLSETCHAMESIRAEFPKLRDEIKRLSAELESTRGEITSEMERQARETNGMLESTERRLEATIHASWQEAIVETGEKQHRQEHEITQSLETIKNETQNKTQQVMGEIRRHLERHDGQLAEVASRLQDQINKEHIVYESEIRSVREEVERRLRRLDGETVSLHQAVEEASQMLTRRVQWTIRDASWRLHVSKTQNWFSPKFSAGGERALQLELQVLRPPPESSSPEKGGADLECGDCVVNLWACKGVEVTFRVFLGEVYSPVFTHRFNGWAPCGTRRLWFLQDQLNQETDSLQIGLELLEMHRTLDSPPRARSTVTTEGFGDASAGVGGGPPAISDEPQLEGSISFHRHVNNKMVDSVQAALVRLQSHMIRRVEWRLEQASSLRMCYPKGSCICSLPFVTSGVEGLQLAYYPSGCKSAQGGYSSLFLKRPANNANIKAWLRVGKQRWEASPVEICDTLFGRINFCRFENCFDPSDDTLLITLEVQEAPQDVLRVGAQQDPWRSPLGDDALGHHKPSAPAGPASTVSRLRSKMARTPTLKTVSPPKAEKLPAMETESVAEK